MIATCARPACGFQTDLPDDMWIVVRPMTWNAFVEESTYCSPKCVAVAMTERHEPPKGLLP